MVGLNFHPVHGTLLYLFCTRIFACPNYYVLQVNFLCVKYLFLSETFDLDLTAIPSEDALADNAEFETEAEKKTTCSVVSEADSDSSADVDGDTSDDSELDSDSELEEEFEFLSQEDL